MSMITTIATAFEAKFADWSDASYVAGVDNGWDIESAIVSGTINGIFGNFEVWTAMDSEGEPHLVNFLYMTHTDPAPEGMVMQSWFQYPAWDLQGTEDAASYMNWSCSWVAPAAEVLSEIDTAIVEGSCGATLLASFDADAYTSVKGPTDVDADTCAISDEMLESASFFATEFGITSAGCWVTRPFTQTNMSTLEYEETQTVIAGINAFTDATSDSPTQSSIDATEFVVPTALEGATTLMAAFVTGAAATLLF